MDQAELKQAAPKRPFGLPLFSLVVWALAGVSLFGQLARAGIWDPYELEVAEYSRRIAVALMDTPKLALPGMDNRVPILSELGKGQLPFSSVALGFKLFGLNDWSGRLPLALWSLLGLLATYVLVRRLLDRRAAPFAVLVLASCPLYFLQARTMLGDAVTMAALAIACAGMGLVTFDDRLRPLSVAWWAALGAGVLGLLSGFGSRGLLLGVAVPALGVALTAVLLGPALSWRVRSTRFFTALGCGVVGLLALGFGCWALLGASSEHYSMLLGSTIDAPRKLPTHDAVLHALGHGMLPWSALVPFALGALLRSPPVVEPVQATRETALRLLLLLVSTLALLAQGLLAPMIGELPFCAVFAFAGAVAVMARDLERGRPASLATGIGALALLVLLVFDFRQFPEKGLSAFVVGDASIPDTFKDSAKRYLEIGGVIALGGSFLSLWEQSEGPLAQRAGVWQRLREVLSRWRGLFSRDAWRARFARGVAEDYRAWPQALRGLLLGNPLYTLLPLEAVLVGLFLQQRGWTAGVTLFPELWFSKLPKHVVGYAWLAVPALLLVPTLIVLLRDAVRLLFRWLPITRASAAVCSFAVFGFVLSFGYYPALASQLSPREVFDTYREFARQGDELGMIGSSSGTAGYYTGGGTRVFGNVREATEWLLEQTEVRRYLVVSQGELGKLNSRYRSAVSPARNLPVVDARSSEIVLASNRLDGANQNPLDDIVLSERPTPAHDKGGVYADELTCMGWEIVDQKGKVVDILYQTLAYKFRTFYHVEKKVTGTWKGFIHLDSSERINLDHDLTADKYPSSLWNPGDYIIDEHEFTVPRGQTRGRYSVNFGLFQGSRRKEVTAGVHQDNRLSVGEIEIR